MIEALGSLREFHVLKVFTHERLDHADGLDVLLHALVQLVVLHEHLLEQAGYPRDDVVERETEYQHRHNEYDRQAGIDDQAHDDAKQQPEGSAHGNAQQLRVGILQVVDIGGHTGDETSSGVLVDVGKGEPLNVAVHGHTQVGSKAR